MCVCVTKNDGAFPCGLNFGMKTDCNGMRGCGRFQSVYTHFLFHTRTQEGDGSLSLSAVTQAAHTRLTHTSHTHSASVLVRERGLDHVHTHKLTDSYRFYYFVCWTCQQTRRHSLILCWIVNISEIKPVIQNNLRALSPDLLHFQVFVFLSQRRSSKPLSCP